MTDKDVVHATAILLEQAFPTYWIIDSALSINIHDKERPPRGLEFRLEGTSMKVLTYKGTEQRRAHMVTTLDLNDPDFFDELCSCVRERFE
jgi:hypothetical protein